MIFSTFASACWAKSGAGGRFGFDFFFAYDFRAFFGHRNKGDMKLNITCIMGRGRAGKSGENRGPGYNRNDNAV
jgi:hypothetical protein